MNSPSQALLKEIAGLKQKKIREETGLILVEGRHPVEEALPAGLKLRYWFTLQGAAASHLPNVEIPGPAYAVDEKQMARIASTTSPPPCIGVFEHPSLSKSATGDWQLVLDGLQDPGNLGTLIRSAIAFGVDAVVLTPDCVEPFNPKVIRASAGLIFAVPLAVQSREALLAQFQQENRRVLVTTGQPQALPYDAADYSGLCALVLGNEGQGVSEILMQAPQTQAITIPMAAKVESLNVAISGSVILAKAAAQRTQAEGKR